jgi:fructokinase
MEYRKEIALSIGTLGVLGLLAVFFRKRTQHLACIEAGGTFFRVSIVDASTLETISKHQFRTEDPNATVDILVNWLKDKEFARIGIASFGPVELNEASPQYGSITTTPKPGWRNFPLLSSLRSKLNFSGPVGFDTDVNGAALAEFALGNHGVTASLAYVTVGTGVGVGIISSGKPLRGLIHTEGGHIRVARHPNDSFQGSCPFHADCLEGMVTNGALSQRLQVDALVLNEIPDESEVWDIVAFYLAQLCISVTLLVTPEAIILGGGIMQRKLLFGLIRTHFTKLLNKYLEHPHLESDLYIRPAALQDSGLLGAAYLAKLAH